MTEANFVVDKEALKKAEIFIGLTVPVRVYRLRLKMWGDYGWDHQGFHRIQVRKALSWDLASGVIWHELCHAWQYECCGHDAWAFDKAYHRGMGPEPKDPDESYKWHRSIPFEAQAYEWKKHHEWLPLTIPA